MTFFVHKLLEDLVSLRTVRQHRVMHLRQASVAAGADVFLKQILEIELLLLLWLFLFFF